MLRDPCSSPRLPPGTSSGTCFADVSATPNHAPGDGAGAHVLGSAGEWTKLISARAPAVRFPSKSVLSGPTVPEGRLTDTRSPSGKAESKMATRSSRVPEARGCPRDGAVAWGAGGGGDGVQVRPAGRLRLLCPVCWFLRPAFLGPDSLCHPPSAFSGPPCPLRDSSRLTSTPPATSWMAPAFSLALRILGI